MDTLRENAPAPRPLAAASAPCLRALALAAALAAPAAPRAAPVDPGVRCEEPGCVLPPARRTEWNPGLNAVGGIPARTKICATVPPSGGDDSGAITAALDACPDNQVVQLLAGDYHFGKNGQVRFRRSHVTLRGKVDAAGRPITRFMLADDHDWPVILFGEAPPDEGALRQPVPLVKDAEKGSRRVQLAANPGYVVGELVTLDQLHDPDTIWLNESRFHAGPGGGPSGRNMFCKTDRFVGQVLEIVEVHGNELVFSTPLHSSFPVSRQATLWRHSRDTRQDVIVTHPVKYAGAEDIYVEGGHYGGAAAFGGVAYCWLRNLEVYRWLTSAVSFTRSLRCVLRDSYIHQTQDPNPGGGGYALSIEWHSADNLVENDIHWAANKVIVMRASGGGNVVGYSYFEDGFGAGYPAIPEVGLNASHYAGSHAELFEGNLSWNFGGDDVWGNSFDITALRNHLTGVRRNAPGVTTSGARGQPVDFRKDAGGRRMVFIAGKHDGYTFLGNVLGEPGAVYGPWWSYESTTPAGRLPAVWNIGIDGQSPPLGVTQEMCDRTRASTLRHGNLDFVTKRVAWDDRLPGRTLPPSLYLKARPAFFGDLPWPWVTPEQPSPLGQLPAQRRFEQLLQQAQPAR